MRKIIKSAGIFIRAVPSIILFELLYKLLITAIALPALTYLIRWAVDISGVGYITAENLIQFLTYPASLAIILLILIICSVLSLAEISAVISGFAMLYQKKQISVSLMIKAGFRSTGKLFKKFNFILIFYVLLILPITQLTLTSGIFVFIGMPDIQTLYGISGNKIFFAVITVFILLSALLSDRIYCLHFFTLTDLRYSESVKKSRKITEGKRFRTALSVIIWSIAITAFFLIIFFLICFIISFAMKGFSEPDTAFFISLKLIKKIVSIFKALSSVFFTPMLFAYITSIFMTEIDKDTEIILPEPAERTSPVKIRIIAFTVFAVSVALNYSFMKDISAENIMLNVSFLNKTKITAHRGFSSKAPENTEPAFQEALEIGADFIELDVQLSHDGEIVVFHDKSLSRITGIKEQVRNMTYSQLLELDYGKWFGDEFKGTAIMTLDEVLEKFGNKINLNIEIKKTDDELDTARITAELIKKYNCEDSCYVTSFSYNALRAVKKINPDIKTGLISNFMTYGGYSTLHDIDALSLNKKFVSQNLINNIHLNGKRVFIWTVNDRSEADKFIRMGADNIITDKPDMVIKAVSSKGSDAYIIDFLTRIFNY